MRKQNIIICAAVAVFLAALLFTLYPMISSAYNARHQAALEMAYIEQVQNAENSKIEKVKAAAVAYNEALAAISQENPYSTEALQQANMGYSDMLVLTDTETMGYIRIPCLNISLPIYHGTADTTLERGIGHLLGSTLPVGGEGNAVLTGHSGLSSQPMFSDLVDMDIGDVFYIDVLGQTLAYQVDQIKTVLPTDSTYLGIEKGEDHVTLVTCTPFGVNTHRLLVRGTRIELPETDEVDTTLEITSHKSSWQMQYLKGIWIGVGIAVLTGSGAAAYILFQRKRRNNETV